MSETTSTSAAAVSAAAPDCGCGHPASFHTPHCYDVCGCEVFHTAAAPDEREAPDVERLPERFRFSREVYGDVADDATRVLLALTDGGHADQPSDYLRWVSITAAQALAARPAPCEREATPDEAHDIGYTRGHTDGYREAMAALAARSAPTNTTTTAAAEIIRAHEVSEKRTVTGSKIVYDKVCEACGAELPWDDWRDALARHQADELARAGLLADAPAAEPEYSERDNACGYCGRVHGDLAACGPAADDEGGQE